MPLGGSVGSMPTVSDATQLFDAKRKSSLRKLEKAPFSPRFLFSRVRAGDRLTGLDWDWKEMGTRCERSSICVAIKSDRVDDGEEENRSF
ncbi:hypothetical protein SUGI_0350810 [Cryptomeria japonica]|nr:hypothetical protein SUGI_0350810 [Cryptomeria japonica]